MLLGTVTTYRPYPHMRLGLKLKLVDLRTGKLVWAIEQVWDAAEASMEGRLKRFFAKHMRRDWEPLGWQLALTSPRAFERFVAWETSQTLPHPLSRPRSPQGGAHPLSPEL